MRRVIANGVAWARTDRPERSHPGLLRYETGEFFNGQGYAGPLGSDVPDDRRRHGGPLRVVLVGAGGMGRAWLDAVAAVARGDARRHRRPGRWRGPGGRRRDRLAGLPVGTDAVALARRDRRPRASST